MLAILTFLWTFSFLKISVASSKWFFSKILCPCQPGRFPPNPSRRGFHVLLSVPCQEGQVEDKRDPVPVDEEQEGQESVNGGLGDDVGVEAVAQVDGVNVVAGAKSACAWPTRDRAPRHNPSYAGRSVLREAATHHSRSLYMMVKKTCRNRLTAFINTARRYSHASPVIVKKSCAAWCEVRGVMGAR